MYHIVYLTRNTINNKLYVGVHSTFNLNDGYLGSSTQLRDAVRKYGVDAFNRTILHFCLTREDTYVWEKWIVDKQFIASRDTYNMKEGGRGGLTSFNHTGATKKKQSASKANTPKITCEYCSMVVDPQNYAQLHGKYCESNPTRIPRPITKLVCSVCHLECTRIDYYNNHEQYCKHNPNREIRVMPLTICEHCGKQVDTRNYSRFHGTRCKSNPNRIPMEGKICEYCNREIDNKNYTRFHGIKCKLYLGVLNPTASQ